MGGGADVERDLERQSEKPDAVRTPGRRDVPERTLSAETLEEAAAGRGRGVGTRCA
jgi:hypothetical protein